MNERMWHEMSGILGNVDGDIIDFRVYKGTTFAHLVKLADLHGRHAVGMDTFYGLEEPTRADYNEHNQLAYPRGYAKGSVESVHQAIKKICPDNAPYELHGGKLESVFAELKDREYAIALIDLFQYQPTKKAIEYIYTRMAPGGVIYFLNYHKGSKCLASKAIGEFLEEFIEDIYQYPPIYLNDNLLNICRVSCRQFELANRPQNSTTESITKKESKVKRIFTKEKVNIALVLRTGGDTYDHRYVNALAANIRKNTTVKYNLSVLTDDSSGIDPNLVDETIPFKHNYKGWWSKIELFRPEIFTGERVFYMDLDTVIVKNIDEMLKFKTTFSGIRDLYHKNFLQTGVMSWNPEYNNHIYQSFVPRAHHVMTNYPEGDAKWIRENVYNYDYLTDNFQGRIVSYKAHCLKRDGSVVIPSDASIICFHGKPRPHTITSSVITDHWKY